MKKLCLVLFVAASIAAAYPRGSVLAHHRMPGPWIHPPAERFVPVWGFLPLHLFFMMW
jgi:hypothetical protein